MGAGGATRAAGTGTGAEQRCDMSKSTVLALLCGLASALPLLFAFVVPGGALFMLLVPLPLFLSGLSLGSGAALISAATACASLGLMLAAMSATVTGSLATGLGDGFGVFVGTVVTLGAPAVVLVRQALLNRPAADGSQEWYPAGLLVLWLTGAGVLLLAFSLVSLLFFAPGPGLEAAFTAQLADALRLVLPSAPEEELQAAAASAAQIGLGVGVDSWLMVFAANGLLAQGVLTRYGRNLRPGLDPATLDLPNWLALVLAGCAAAAVLGSGDFAFLAKSLVLILLLPYFFAGLAVVHAACRNRKARALLLILFYLMLVFFAWPAVIVTGLGVIDQWTGLRRRLLAAAGERESE